MTTFGENFYNYIAIHFLRQDVIVYIEMMLMFAGYPDIIPVNNADNDSVSGEDAVTSNLHITPDEARKIHETSLITHRRFLIEGSYADWFKSHPQYILSALNYLIPALSDAELALSAAMSFKEPREKQKVIESIADVIQALPPDKMLQPLMNPPQYREVIIAQLEYLTCCCRGIQPPDDKVVILDDIGHELQHEKSFFATGSSVGLVNTLLEITSNIAEIWYHDSEVIEVSPVFRFNDYIYMPLS
ncbi:14138_t:CDS:2 [Racocetra fulgida]|uniref:14138_t:CDS:1 n=1 Tax=Racocetra fulgida TaxID=60492 RepID=A0A9N9C0J1_9GLOM|nr:14138_t:CDS:2 [Racocetra fulgida]